MGEYISMANTKTSLFANLQVYMTKINKKFTKEISAKRLNQIVI